MSAMRSIPVWNESFITIALTNDRSVAAPVPRSPPMKSIWSAICCAVRVVVPWSSSDAIRFATPPFPFGSCAEPAPTSRRMLTAGCSWCSTATTRMPLGRERISYGGKVTSCAASGRGAAPRASLALAREPGPKIPTPKSQNPTHKGGSSPASTIAALRHDVEHRAVLLAEVGPRDALDVGGGEIQEHVDLVVRGPDVVVDDRGVREVERLLLVALAADDVVAHELVL